MDRILLKQKVKAITGDRALIPQIAKVCNVSLPTVHNWLSGKTKMPVDYVLPIQEAFSFTDEEVMEIFIRCKGE